MYYPDLGTNCQIASAPRVRAVGWLSDGHEFPRGGADSSVIERLELLRGEGWVHVAVPGLHLCTLCNNVRDSRNILVPSADLLYVAPGMIVHYMKDHAYAPPAEFSEAVLACPAPLTDEYDAALRRFLDVFSPSTGRPMSVEDFDRCTRRHREWRAQLAAEAAAEASRKRFTWD